MARGPVATDREKRLLTQVAFRLYRQYEEGDRSSLPTTREVLEVFNARNERDRGQSWVEKELAKLRKNGRLPRPGEIKPSRQRKRAKSDPAWSIGTMSKAPLPASALPSVVEVWRHSLAIHKPLSVREARWVAWLSALPRLKNGEPLELLYYAREYALQERAVEGAENRDGPEVALDILVFHVLEFEAALATNQLSMERNRRILDERTARLFDTEWMLLQSSDAGQYAEAVVRFDRRAPFQKAPMETYPGLTGWGRVAVKRSHEPVEPPMPLAQDLVYAYYLIDFCKSEQWPLRSEEERMGIMALLRNWVRDSFNNVESAEKAGAQLLLPPGTRPWKLAAQLGLDYVGRGEG